MGVELQDLRLVVLRRCDVCDGTSEVPGEEWAEFHDYRSGGGTSDPEEFFLERQGFNVVPPMQRECGACEGGTQHDDIALSEVINLVLEQLPQAVIPADELAAVVSDLQGQITQAALRSRGLADPDDAGSWLRVVQEGAEALRAVSDLLASRRDA
jgi:hypothetical protein